MYGLSSLSEAIGYLICYFIEKLKFDRKYTFMAFLILAHVSCLCISLIQLKDESLSSAKEFLYITAFKCIVKSMTSAATNWAYVFTSQMFDTRVRSRALLFVSAIGRLGSTVAPQVNLLGDLVLKQLPYVVFCVVSFISCVSVFLLPNPSTLNYL